MKREREKESMSQVILFDLDGTLTESGEGITKSVQYALDKMGIVEKDLEKLRCFVGPPLKEQFMSYAGFDETQAEQAVRYYREYYTSQGIFENRLYPQIPELLEVLKINDKILGVASSKPEIFVKQILEHFQVAQYFQVIVGSELDGARTEKAQVIEEALKRLHMEKERDKVLMVGDKEHDVLGAKVCGIQCVGVTYGYGSRQELEQAGAVYLAESVDDLGILASPNDEETTEYVESVRKPYRKKKKKKLEHTDSKNKIAQEAKVQPEAGERVLTYSPMRQFWRILYPILMHFGISVFVIICVNFYYIGKILSGSLPATVNTDEMILNTSLQQLVFSSIISGGIAYFIYRNDQRRRREGVLGKNPDFIWRPMIVWCSVLVLAIAGSQLLNDLIWVLRLDQIFPSYGQMMTETLQGQPMWLQILAIGILGPIAEELIFRGLVFRRMKDCMKPTAAIILSAVFFGLYHGNMIQFLYAGLFGCVLAVMYHRTGTLWTSILAHVAANLWSLLGAEWWNLTIRQIPMGVVIAIIVEILFCVIPGYWFFAYKKNKQK